MMAPLAAMRTSALTTNAGSILAKPIHIVQISNVARVAVLDIVLEAL